MNAAQEPPAKRQRLSYNSSVASGDELNVLLVGSSDLCQPIATALLQVKFDRRARKRHDKDDAAVAALRRHCSFEKPTQQRKVHMVEEWSEFLPRTNTNKNNVCMDHVVLVVTPSNVDASLRRLKEAANVLEDSCVALQRVSVVLMMEPVHGFRDAEPITSRLFRRKRKREASLFGAPVPHFPCQVQERKSHLAVSRMILQRAKLGIRQGSSTLPNVSPMIFASYS